MIQGLNLQNYQTKPYQTKPNELKLLPDIENLISGNFYPWKFFDLRPHFMELTAFLKAFRKENNIFSFWGSQNKNDHFGHYVSKSTQFFLTFFVFWRKLSELNEKSYGLPSILCSGHSNFFSFDLRLLSFWDQKDIACPLPKSYAESKTDQNWPNESKNKVVTFSWFTAFQKSMFFEGSKKAGFWPKTQLFLIFLGTPISHETKLLMNWLENLMISKTGSNNWIWMKSRPLRSMR